ncbi:MAG: Rpn family recombination-promoting nuclease/putative transposase [Gammaproteobacteria bacterium]|nr:Rpn family recombination-promoting nuclease/putative transposase [Gammaproteobacteria bacterium]
MQHNSGYHPLFSHPELVEDLFKSFVTEPWVAQLDFTTLQRVNAKLHAEGLERRDGDLIYRVLYRDGSEVYLYLLLEFQSQPDPWMAIRALVYVGLLYQHLIRENRLTPNGKLPPVFPLVLYNGDTRWNVAQEIKDLIALPSNTPLWLYQPTLRYYLVDESRYPEGKAGSLVGVLFQIENCKNLDELRPIVKHLAEHWQKQIPASLRRAFISWIRRVVAPGKGVELEPQDIEDFAEVQIMLATRIKQWEQEIRKQEFEKGIEKGILTGEAKLLHRQLQMRFGALPPWAEEKLTHATSAQIEQWGTKILSAVSLDEVFA